MFQDCAVFCFVNKAHPAANNEIRVGGGNIADGQTDEPHAKQDAEYFLPGPSYEAPKTEASTLLDPSVPNTGRIQDQQNGNGGR